MYWQLYYDFYDENGDGLYRYKSVGADTKELFEQWLRLTINSLKSDRIFDIMRKLCKETKLDDAFEVQWCYEVYNDVTDERDYIPVAKIFLHVSTVLIEPEFVMYLEQSYPEGLKSLRERFRV